MGGAHAQCVCGYQTARLPASQTCERSVVRHSLLVRRSAGFSTELLLISEKPTT